MTFKITFARGNEIQKALVEGSSIKDAMRRGYQQHAWDSVLEVSTPDDQPIQGVAAKA